MLRKLLYFGSNKNSIPPLSPPGYRSTRIYTHQKRPFSRYEPWAYIRDFTVTQKVVIVIIKPIVITPKVL